MARPTLWVLLTVFSAPVWAITVSTSEGGSLGITYVDDDPTKVLDPTQVAASFLQVQQQQQHQEQQSSLSTVTSFLDDPTENTGYQPLFASANSPDLLPSATETAPAAPSGPVEFAYVETYEEDEAEKAKEEAEAASAVNSPLSSARFAERRLDSAINALRALRQKHGKTTAIVDTNNNGNNNNNQEDGEAAALRVATHTEQNAEVEAVHPLKPHWSYVISADVMDPFGRPSLQLQQEQPGELPFLADVARAKYFGQNIPNLIKDRLMHAQLTANAAIDDDGHADASDRFMEDRDTTFGAGDADDEDGDGHDDDDTLGDGDDGSGEGIVFDRATFSRQLFNLLSGCGPVPYVFDTVARARPYNTHHSRQNEDDSPETMLAYRLGMGFPDVERLPISDRAFGTRDEKMNEWDRLWFLMTRLYQNDADPSDQSKFVGGSVKAEYSPETHKPMLVFCDRHNVTNFGTKYPEHHRFQVESFVRNTLGLRSIHRCPEDTQEEKKDEEVSLEEISHDVWYSFREKEHVVSGNNQWECPVFGVPSAKCESFGVLMEDAEKAFRQVKSDWSSVHKRFDELQDVLLFRDCGTWQQELSSKSLTAYKKVTTALEAIHPHLKYAAKLFRAARVSFGTGELLKFRQKLHAVLAQAQDAGLLLRIWKGNLDYWPSSVCKQTVRFVDDGTASAGDPVQVVPGSSTLASPEEVSPQNPSLVDPSFLELIQLEETVTAQVKVNERKHHNALGDLQLPDESADGKGNAKDADGHQLRAIDAKVAGDNEPAASNVDHVSLVEESETSSTTAYSSTTGSSTTVTSTTTVEKAASDTDAHTPLKHVHADVATLSEFRMWVGEHVSAARSVLDFTLGTLATIGRGLDDICIAEREGKWRSTDTNRNTHQAGSNDRGLIEETSTAFSTLN